jgi:hypothetical protein
MMQTLARVGSQYEGVSHPQNHNMQGRTLDNFKARVARNILIRMQDRFGTENRRDFYRRVYWTHGKRKGLPISSRTLKYVFDTREDSPSPSLDIIVAIAAALDCEPWELLVDAEETRRHILDQVMRGHDFAAGHPRKRS